MKPEKATSVQVGVESQVLSGVRLKFTGFYHRISDSWIVGEEGYWINGGASARKGGEAELATSPWHNLRLVANATYTIVTPEGDGAPNSASTATNLILRYRDQAGWNGELAGQYIWWDDEHVGNRQAVAPIWNASLGRTVYRADRLARADLIVYVAVGPRVATAHGALRFVGASATFRFVHVSLDQSLTHTELVAVLGHELQHAVEVAGSPDIRDTESFRRYYQQQGEVGAEFGWFETEAARRTGRRVREDLARRDE